MMLPRRHRPQTSQATAVMAAVMARVALAVLCAFAMWLAMVCITAAVGTFVLTVLVDWGDWRECNRCFGDMCTLMHCTPSRAPRWRWLST